MPAPRAVTPVSPVGHDAIIAALGLMARTATDAIAVTDLDAKVVIWNPAAERLFGVPADIALGRSIYDLTESTVVGGGDMGDVRRATLATGSWRGRRVERARIGPHAGQEVIVELALSRVDDMDGSVLGILSIRRDVTASVHFEQEFAALGALATTTGVARTRAEVADGAIDLMCTAMQADLGFITRHEGDAALVDGSRGLSPALMATIEGRGIRSSPLAAALKSPGGVIVGPVAEVPLRAASRREIRAAGIRVVAAVGLHLRGDLIGLMALGWSNETLPRPSEAALLQAAGYVEHALENIRLVEGLVESERRYRTLFDESPQALLLETLDGEIVDANDAASRIFAADRMQLVGRSGDGITGGRADAFLTAHAAAGSDGHALARSTATTVDGRSFPAELQFAPVEIAGTPRLLVLVRDLTAEAELQAELIQAQKMDAIGQLVSGVAHELNNPLAAIIAFSQLLGSDPNLPAELRRDADIVNQEADRTRRIVQNLLDFARQRPPERHPTRLHALIRTVLELQAYDLSSGHIDVAVDVPRTLPPVPVDRSQLQQVLLNLIRNAVQAIGAGAGHGRISFHGATVDAAPRGGPTRSMVRLTITDDGPGVDPADRDRLFVAFFTTKPPGEGTGLGLPVSFGIIAAHDGNLRYEPGPGGLGASFVIELPIELEGTWRGPADVARPRGHARPRPREVPSPDRSATEVTNGSESGQPGATVLVLDDEPSIRRLLTKILKGAGFKPLTAADGQEAIDLIGDREIDAVVCDHRMAGMSGIDVYRAVTTIRPELAERFIFMSGDVLIPELASSPGSGTSHCLPSHSTSRRCSRTSATSRPAPPTCPRLGGAARDSATRGSDGQGVPRPGGRG